MLGGVVHSFDFRTSAEGSHLGTMRYVDILYRMPDVTGPFRGSHAVSEGWLTTRQLRSPLFTRLFRGVYLPVRMPVTHELRCHAASLIAPPKAVLTGCSAATIHGIPLAVPEDPVEFVVPESARFVAQRGLDVTRTDVGVHESEPWRSAGLATPLRATVDLLTNTRLRKSFPRLVGLLDMALRADFVDRATLRDVLESRHGHGIVRARKALELADPRAESVPESEVRVWLVLDGLRPEPQVPVFGGMYRLDLAFRERLLAVEYDGEWHAEGDQPERDAERRARLRKAGWEFVIVTKEQLYGDPRGMVCDVREAYFRRGGK